MAFKLPYRSTFPALPQSQGGLLIARNFAEVEQELAALDTRLAAAESELDTISLGAWTSYTPVWTASGGATGGGTLVGRWARTGRSVTVYAELTYTGGMTLPSGNYFLSLPFAAAAGRWQPLSAAYWDGGSGMIPMVASASFAGGDATKVGMQFQASATAWGLNQPVAPAVGDFVIVWGTYEAAS